MMDKEVKTKWVEALRSGKYIQGKRLLHDKDKGTYCCLGVLCEVAVPDRAPWVNAHMVSSQYAATLGCKIYVDDAGTGFPLARLSQMNDDGKTFAEIADYIEANL